MELTEKFNGRSPIDRNSQDDTALHLAISKKNINVQVIYRLLETRAEINKRGVEDRTPLHCSMTFGHAELTQRLIEKGANPNVLTTKRQTPLHCAVEHGCLQAVEAFLQNITEPAMLEQLLLAKDNQGETVLHYAASHSAFDMAKILLHYGRQIENQKSVQVDAQNNRKCTPLYQAINDNVDRELVAALLEAGADPNLADRDGRTPLHRGMNNGNIEIVEALIERGANQMARTSEGQIPFHVAVQYGHVDMMEQLFSRQICLPQECLNAQDLDGKSALHYAALQSNEEMLSALIRYRANVNAETQYGYKPLHFAARQGFLDVVRVLIEQGARVDVKNCNGDSPKKIALQFNQPHIVQLLATKSNRRMIPFAHPHTTDLLAGDILRYRGFFNEALGHYQQLLQKAKQEEDALLQVCVLKKMGDVKLAEGERTKNVNVLIEAAQLFSSALALYQGLPGPERQQMYLDRLLDRLVRLEKHYVQEILGGRKNELFANASRVLLARQTQLHNLRTEAKMALERQESSQHIMNKITDKVIDLTSQMIQECITLVGLVPCEYAIIGLGFMSQREMNLYTDLKIGVLLEKNTNENREYFQKLIGLLKLKIIFLGETTYPVLKEGEESITSRGFALNTIFTPLLMEELMNTPEGMERMQIQNEKYDPIAINMLRTVCLLHGNNTLVREYEGRLIKVLGIQWIQRNIVSLFVDNDKVLSLLQEDLKAFQPRLSKAQEDVRKLNLKDELYRFLSETIRKLCWHYGIFEKNVWYCLEALKKENQISPVIYDCLHKTLEAINGLRLQVQSHYGKDLEEIEVRFLSESFQDTEGTKSVYRLNEEETHSLLNIYAILWSFYKSLEVFCNEGGKTDVLKKEDIVFDKERFVGHGMFYEWLCNYTEAEKSYRHAVECSPSSIEALDRLGKVLRVMHKSTEAQEVYEQILKMKKVLYGDRHSCLVETLHNLGAIVSALATNKADKEIAIAHHNMALEINQSCYGRNSLQVAESLHLLGEVLDDLGDVGIAIEYHKEALRIRVDHLGKHNIEIANSLNYIANAWMFLGDMEEAIALQEEALRICQERPIKNYPKIAQSLNNLGSVQKNVGKIREAIDLFTQALDIFRNYYGENHPEVAASLYNLGSTKKILGENSEAIELLEKAENIFKTIYGETHPAVAGVLNSLGLAKQDLGEHEQAVALFKRALRVVDSEENLDLRGRILNNLGLVQQKLAGAGDEENSDCLVQEAIELFEKSLSIKKDIYGENHLEVANVLSNLGQAYAELNKREEAIQLLQRALRIYKDNYGDNNKDVAKILFLLGMIWESLSQDQAIQYVTNAYDICKRCLGAEHVQTLQVRVELDRLTGERDAQDEPF